MNEERDQGEPSASQAGEAGAVEGPAPRLRLRSLKVHAFRDVWPGTELHFGDGFHLILGKNGTGKSTLLELLGAVSTLDFKRPFFAETPFHLEASLAIGNVALHATIKRTFEAQNVPSVDGNRLDLPPRDEAEVTVRIEQPLISFRRWFIARTGENLRVSQIDPIGSESLSGDSFELQFKLDPLRMSWGLAVGLGALQKTESTHRMHPEMVASLYRGGVYRGTGYPFDEALVTLPSITATAISAGGEDSVASGPGLPPALNFVGRGGPVEFDLSRDPELQRAVTCLGYESARAYFPPPASVNAGWSYSSPSFQFFRNGKAIRRHDQLSFGQQRLFSFAWYLACNPDIAIADELVNGLHSDWIDWCVEAIGDRQCFLTSQNPLLVDAVPLTSEEDIRRGIILCEIAPDTGQLTWRQLDADELDIVSRALAESRLDLLSDLLRALDLW